VGLLIVGRGGKWAKCYQLAAVQRACLQRTKMIDSGKKTAEITEM
jgi:hypothetical protein